MDSQQHPESNQGLRKTILRPEKMENRSEIGFPYGFPYGFPPVIF
jgi:hypothetical protein